MTRDPIGAFSKNVDAVKAKMKRLAGLTILKGLLNKVACPESILERL